MTKLVTLCHGQSMQHQPLSLCCVLDLQPPSNLLQDDAYDVLQEAEDTTEGLRTQVQFPTQSCLLPHICRYKTCMNACIACMKA